MTQTRPQTSPIKAHTKHQNKTRKELYQKKAELFQQRNFERLNSMGTVSTEKSFRPLREKIDLGSKRASTKKS